MKKQTKEEMKIKMVNAKTLGTVYIHTGSLETIKEKVIEIMEDSNKSLKWKGLLLLSFLCL